MIATKRAIQTTSLKFDYYQSLTSIETRNAKQFFKGADADAAGGFS